MAFKAGDSRGHDGINFIRVDKSAGATQSLDRSQFRRHLKCPALKIIMLGIKKGSNVWVMPFKCNKSLYLSRFMDRCIYVDTGPLILWQMRGLDMYNRYVQIYFPVQKKKRMKWWIMTSWICGLAWLWRASAALSLLLPTAHCSRPHSVKHKGPLSPMSKTGNGWYEGLIENGLLRRLLTYRNESDSLPPKNLRRKWGEFN